LAAVLTLETQTKGRVRAADDHSNSLEERASRLASELSPAAFRIYGALVKAGKWPFTIALNGESCGACNMRLPSGLVGEIRRMTTLHRCPFCKRVLAETTVPS
jgi:predicted  nucleic acid-binding Zn-ribbon protein